jgi:hypothetical protein
VYRSFQKILTGPQKCHATRAPDWRFLSVTLPVYGDMKIKVLLLLVFFGTAAGTPVFAATVPNQDHLSTILQYPGAPRPVHEVSHLPYAMNYAEEVARNLGVRDGHMDVFSTSPEASGYLPSISGGVGGDGAMLRLKWHPGE